MALTNAPAGVLSKIDIFWLLTLVSQRPIRRDRLFQEYGAGVKSGDNHV
jgi:hypothetical protein